MAIDKLQKQIRVLKNPSSVKFMPDKAVIPPAYLEAEPEVLKAYFRYCADLLEALKGILPAVRFGFSAFAVCGTEGLDCLARLIALAKDLGYYVLLDAPEVYSPKDACLAAEGLADRWQFDGLILGCCIGSDGIRPFIDSLKNKNKELFLILRTANRSAPELQDLLTGTRLVYNAAADLAKRLGEDDLGRCGYSRIAGVGPATSADALKMLRSKYPSVFLLIDGYDYSGANAKNCSFAFDKLGHGAMACAEESITAAWKEADFDISALDAAVQAAERMKKNLTRYVTVL